ncbi:MAG: 23S rRNA (adenine(2503)-C(2))-methyltransferase RlmN [Acetivibrionales bacterium]|jgi:23S rRNA (adenine2503-C2)-methyltransferase
MQQKVNLLDMDIEQLQNMLVNDMGQPKFRVKQVFKWLNRGIREIDEMTDISKPLREQLKRVSYIGNLRIIKKLTSGIDNTTKYLLKLNDGNVIESVIMEYKHGLSICISSQVGCKMGCAFCASTGIGFVRNLTAGELLGQVLSIQNDIGQKINNIVIMGIGEPFDNYDNIIRFLRIIHMPEGLNIGFRRITISTSGLVPQIIKFSKEGMPVNLSVSLHASNDDLRRKIMPVNKKYSIDKLIEACKIYTGVTKRRITFEYIMISLLNDSRECAIELAERLKGMLCHVNLIPMNDVEGLDYSRSSKRAVEDFKRILEQNGIETTIRRELGNDINAACGQLRRKTIE